MQGLERVIIGRRRDILPPSCFLMALFGRRRLWREEKSKPVNRKICHAAFAGCSADAEVSFETVVSLAEKLDTLNLSAVLVSETSDKTLAKAIVENSKAKDQKIFVLDSIQSVTADQIKKGISYLSIMEDNLAVLRNALQKQA